MLRLIVIRIFESAIRNIYAIIAPIILVPIISIAFQVVRQPSYLSGATIQIRYNYEISDFIGYEKFPTDPLDPSERMVNEVYELLGTDAFVDGILENVDLTDENGNNEISSSRSAQREFLRDNIQVQMTGIRQVAILAYMPTEASAQQVILALFDEYIEHQIATIGGSGRDLVDYMTIYLNAKNQQKDQVQAELENYLLTHPEDPSFDRREIEVTQIALLTTILDDLVGDIDYTNDILDLGSLLEGTSERYFEETFILLDDPFAPVSMTSLTKKISNVIQSIVVGFVLSLLVLGSFVVFDRRVTLPLDLSNTTDLPLLTMVPMEHISQKRRYNIQERRKSLMKQLNKWLEERSKPKPLQPKRRGDGYKNRDLNSLRR